MPHYERARDTAGQGCDSAFVRPRKRESSQTAPYPPHVRHAVSVANVPSSFSCDCGADSTYGCAGSARNAHAQTRLDALDPLPCCLEVLASDSGRSEGLGRGKPSGGD